MEALISSIATSGNIALIIAVIAWVKETQRTSRLETRLDDVLSKMTTALMSQATSNEASAAAIDALTKQVDMLVRKT